jgi:hypothetical protein
MDIKKNIFKFDVLLLFLLIFILTKYSNFFKNTYIILQESLNERYEKIAFDFCKKNSSGYIFYIKKKFALKEKPLIINYNIEPEQNWIFHKDNIYKISNDIILLNYVDTTSYNFKKNEETGLWVSYDMATPNTTLGASHLIFNGEYKKNLNEKFKIEFYKKEVAVLNDVEKIKFEISDKLNTYSELGKIKFKINNNKNHHKLDKNIINFDDHDSLKIIKLDENFDDTNIDKIELVLNEKIDFENYSILDNYKNKCMYLSYND